ncbi:hypothetical protein PUY80_04490 [Plantibacter flavus]|uniref:hypothetical protein n=1 Tax=Plantibacter flavus TaxID=150123 RepID=UPI002379B1F4|nr:hypothetical protein [Plantibacter flavus]MDD9151830.1 hypothetical protein [Plantibacter flavus]
MTRRILTTVTATAVLVIPFLMGGPASAEPSTVETVEVTSEHCVDQIDEIRPTGGSRSAADYSICQGQVTVEESAPVRATQADIQEARAAGIMAGPEAWYRNWTHTYLGGGLAEIHRGRTFWDGDVAWIRPYGGIGGSHECHTEGSWAVGWAVKRVLCDQPAAGPSADAFYRFDASILFQGSPVTLGIGLHYSTNASGGTTAWQVGG